MKRRTYLASGASAIVTGSLATVLAYRTTNRASAQVDIGGLSMQGDSATTKEGYIEDVSVSVSGKWSYELPGGTPTEWIVSLRVADQQGTFQKVAQTSGSLQYNLYNSEYSVSGTLVENGPFDQATFSAPGPGETKTVEMPFEVWFRVLNDADTKLADATATDTATVSVTQESIDASQYGNVGGTGSVTIEKP